MFYGNEQFGDSLLVYELVVPSNIALLSSYHVWNDLLDVVIGLKALPRSMSEFEYMFDDPLLKHPYDCIQAVIPYVARKWITDIRPLELDNNLQRYI